MYYLGVDIGSHFISLAQIDNKSNLVKDLYVRHQGEPLSCLKDILEDIPLDKIKGLVKTGSSGQNIPLSGKYIDPLVAGIEGVKITYPEVRNIIYIGGGSFSLAQLDNEGNYRRSTINSACASGTGAFLDQQAMRLKIHPSELADKALTYKALPPSVATRCAVFAKSDMIHLQQEGYSVEAISAGLCRGLGHSTVDGLLGGHGLDGTTAIIGGVANNNVVVKSIKEKLGIETIVPKRPEIIGAYGAALTALNTNLDNPIDIQSCKKPEVSQEKNNSYLRSPLELKLSKYPDFKTFDHWTNEDKSEIAIINQRTGNIVVTLGIDIGSTSTKAAIMDNDQKVVGWVYRETAGNPIKATQLVFKAFSEMETRGNFSLDIQGVGTTGSGRKMIASVVKAHMSMNEITAHAKAATFIDPKVDTIIELGGQDAKFTQLQNGMVYNSVMNYVCAAGTGSFIAEQAIKLNIPLTEYADRAMGVPCPTTSDRCTVYMERDLDILISKRWKKEQIAASVLHSVRDNYLNKVVGGLHIGDHIYFQGATARNKALVAAFEVELGRPIQVSSFCHITGALGMCLLVRERVSPSDIKNHFKGLGFANENIIINNEICELCHNKCNLKIIQAGNDTVAWGLKCGRDYTSNKVKVKKTETYTAWKQMETKWSGAGRQPFKTTKGPNIGLLRSLSTYGYYPFWRAFFSELECNLVLSSRSSDKVFRHGLEITTAEYCAPVVMSHGHTMSLLQKNNLDFLFVPHMLREKRVKGFSESHFCCYVQSHPGVLKSIEEFNLNDKMLSPIVDLNQPEEETLKQLTISLNKPLKTNKRKIRKAFRAAQKAQKEFESNCLDLGKKSLSKLEEEDQIGIVCIGRPYNTIDPGLNLDLPKKIAEKGYDVLYMNMLPIQPQKILPEYSNMYWHYGQKILACADYIANHPRLFGVYFSNFMCGPDAYLLTYFKNIMGREGKPYLALQFDGHGADAGYLTRVEAAIESFHTWGNTERSNV